MPHIFKNKKEIFTVEHHINFFSYLHCQFSVAGSACALFPNAQMLAETA